VNVQNSTRPGAAVLHRQFQVDVAAVVLFLVLWMGLWIAGRSAMLQDPGSFWHLVGGQKILAAGQVPRVDSFSFTAAGRPWIDDQWLAECGMAAVYEIAGWDALLLASVSLLAGLYAWIGVRMFRAGLHPLLLGVLLALALLAGSPQFHVRPVILSIVLLAVVDAWLVDVEAGRAPFRRLWLLVPLFILWTNLHGGALGGWCTVALCAAGWCIPVGQVCNPPHVVGQVYNLPHVVGQVYNLPWERQVANLPHTAWKFILLVALLAATMLVNPYGWDVPRHWLTTISMPLSSLIVEHAPLDWTEPVGWATGVLAAVYLAALIGIWPERPRIAWLLPLVWFLLACQRVRHAPLFAVTAALGLADMLPYSRVGGWLARRGLLASERPRCGWPAWGVPAALVAAALAIQAAGLRVPVVGRGWARFDANRWPVALLPELEAVNRNSADGAPIFNDMNLGGFLIYHAPRLRVFIDDRCALYGTEFLKAYDRARREDPARIELWRREYGFSHALVVPGGGFDEYLARAEGWTLVDRAPSAALYRAP